MNKNNVLKRFSVIGLSVLFAFSTVSLAIPAVTLASTLTSAQVSAIVSLLQSFGADQSVISNVQSALGVSGTGSPTPTATFCHTFATDLTVGSTGSDVTALQTVFGKELPPGVYGQAGVFDEQTAAGVVALQAKYGILQSGYFGPITRAKINTIYGCGNTAIPATPPPTPVIGVSCDPLPPGVTATVVNGQCVYTKVTTPTSPNLSVSISPNIPASQTLTPGTPNATIASYLLDATQSSDDLRVGYFPVQITATGKVQDLFGCGLSANGTQLSSGSTGVNGLINATPGAFSFVGNNSLVIPKGTSVTLTLTCNVSSHPTAGTFIVNPVTGPQYYSVTDVASGVAVTPTVSGGNGPTLTIGGSNSSGSLSVSVDPSTPTYAVVAAGSTGVNMGVIKLHASGENINLTKVGLVLTSGSSQDISNVYLYQGNTLLGTGVFPGSNNTAIVNLNPLLGVHQDSDVLVTIKADLTNIGAGQPGTEGDLIKIDPANVTAIGASSGAAILANATPGVSGVRMFKSVPYVSLDTNSIPSTGLADGHLMRFKITASPAGPVGISKLSFSVLTSGSPTVSSVKLNVFSDSSYSQAVSGNYGASTGQFGPTDAFTVAVTGDDGFVALNNPLEIPAGATYYFSLDGVVASSGSVSITTTLLGDGVFDGGKKAISVSGGSVSGNFVWSGNATTLADLTTSTDWSNGYGISGLPTSGISFTRSISGVTNPPPPIPAIIIPTISSVTPTSGSGGEIITVYGSNLPSSPIIDFWRNGNIFASSYGSAITSVSSTKITFTLDSRIVSGYAPGNYQISVQNPNAPGGIDSNQLPFAFVLPTVTPPPATISAATPASLSFSTVAGSSGVPSQKVNFVFDRTNSSFTNASWQAVSSASWLLASPNIGTIYNGPAVWLDPQVASFSPGTYTATVTFTPASGSSVSFAPITVPVTLTVTTPPTPQPQPTINYFSVSPNPLSSSVPATFTFTWSNVSTASITFTCPAGVSAINGASAQQVCNAGPQTIYPFQSTYNATFINTTGAVQNITATIHTTWTNGGTITTTDQKSITTTVSG